MSSSLLHPPSQLPPIVALQHSQQAPAILGKSTGAISTSLFQSLLSAPETSELWTTYENLLLSCLRTGDDESAHQCLARLVNRFGNDNERIMALKGLLKEADASDSATLNVILKEYEQILQDNPTNIPILKRRVALLRSIGRTPESVSVLISLLDISPTDAEAWAELADLYFSQGLYSQAIFALEEVLVLQPNAWNVHARLGEVLFIAAKSSDNAGQLGEAIKRFSRSIELCDGYLRGYYGLKLTTKQLLDDPSKVSQGRTTSDGFAIPDSVTLSKLDEVATEKLAEIVRRSSSGEKGWQGYDEAEVKAAKELLENDTAAVIR
ncbi:TPR repeat protein oca3 [Daldinia childiae]|uniref:TPR repeat protein oca3 n=1 Tax=Daldinia childiae TaxID=326645 RepID=UPI0014468EEF|nr:TPR repeat protein oca3 [Daldinia childiae]KAF3064578.1 TPR repeat protein oca3 [Daldinia childiae]